MLTRAELTVMAIVVPALWTVLAGVCWALDVPSLLTAALSWALTSVALLAIHKRFG